MIREIKIGLPIMERRDFIVDQIEAIAGLIAALAGKKLGEKDEASMAQTLSDFSGIPLDAFLSSNTQALELMATMLDDDNKKALLAKALPVKNPSTYSETYQKEYWSPLSNQNWILK